MAVELVGGDNGDGSELAVKVVVARADDRGGR